MAPTDDLFHHPERWPRASIDELEELLVRCLLGYGKSPKTDPTQYVSQIYRAYFGRSPVSRRLMLAHRVCCAVDSGETGTWALLPFIWEEDSSQVIAAAAMQAALCTLPPDPAKPTSGAVLVADMALNARHLTNEARVAILCGVIQLGDPALLRDLDCVWRALPAHAGASLVGGTPGTIQAGVINFLIDWLEDLQATGDEDSFGSVAAALARIPLDHSTAVVYLTERNFPTCEHRDRPLRVIGEWTLREYALVIEPRLRSLAAGKNPDQVLTEVLRIWGLAPNPRSLQSGRTNSTARTRIQLRYPTGNERVSGLSDFMGWPDFDHVEGDQTLSPVHAPTSTKHVPATGADHGAAEFESPSTLEMEGGELSRALALLYIGAPIRTLDAYFVRVFSKFLAWIMSLMLAPLFMLRDHRSGAPFGPPARQRLLKLIMLTLTMVVMPFALFKRYLRDRL
jgi:hypothetical protein